MSKYIISRKDQARVDHIMDFYEFDEVAAYMEKVDWYWEGENCIPTESMMREHVRRLLYTTIEAGIRDKQKGSISSGSGGFEVERTEEGKLELRFVIQAWDTWDFDEENGDA